MLSMTLILVHKFRHIIDSDQKLNFGLMGGDQAHAVLVRCDGHFLFERPAHQISNLLVDIDNTIVSW